jgi:hypothetical protein
MEEGFSQRKQHGQNRSEVGSALCHLSTQNKKFTWAVMKIDSMVASSRRKKMSEVSEIYEGT